MNSGEFCSRLKGLGYSFFAGVPCSFFKDTINYVISDKDTFYVSAVNEGAAVGIASGAQLAGKKAAVVMQNAGVGNTINPLTSLNMIYNIPILIFISGRGYGVKDEPQHAIMGRATHKLMEEIGVEVKDLPEDDDEAFREMESFDKKMSDGKPRAFVIRKGTIGACETERGDMKERVIEPHYSSEERPKGLISRYDAIETVSRLMDDRTAVVATTGKISRELFTINDRPLNFYMQGSMGHAAAIGLGVAICKPDRKVVVMDGDGAALMHMGTLSTIGHYAPENLTHIVFDNECHETTGGQGTTSVTARLDDVARSCRYSRVYRVYTIEGLENAVRESLEGDGPGFILVKVSREKKEGIPRITTKYTTEETARIFREALS